MGVVRRPQCHPLAPQLRNTHEYESHCPCSYWKQGQVWSGPGIKPDQKQMLYPADILVVEIDHPDRKQKNYLKRTC